MCSCFQSEAFEEGSQLAWTGPPRMARGLRGRQTAAMDWASGGGLAKCCGRSCGRNMIFLYSFYMVFIINMFFFCFCHFNLKSILKDAEFNCESIHRCGFSFWEHFFLVVSTSIFLFWTLGTPIKVPKPSTTLFLKKFFFVFPFFFELFFFSFFSCIFFYFLL